MRIDILTLFPEAVDAMLDISILGRAQQRGYITIQTHQIRDYTTNKQMQVDDYPYGGGRGAVMQADPLYRCWQHVLQETDDPDAYTIFMSPCGRTFSQEVARELKESHDHLILVCGHYEGVDQRFIDECVDEELSIGDFVLTGGEIPAMAVCDAVCRMVPGVLPDEECFTEESHWNGLLEYPQYSRPEEWHGRKVPDVLLSGHHANVAAWRKKESYKRTMARRPDLFAAFDESRLTTKADRKILQQAKDELAAEANGNSAIYTTGPTKGRRSRWVVLPVVLAAVVLSTLLWQFSSPSPAKPDPSGSSGMEASSALGDGSLFWFVNGEQEHLTLGVQAKFWPFGTSLSSHAMKNYTGDFSNTTFTDVNCGDLSLTYSHISETPEREVLLDVATTAEGYFTPCGIGVASDEADVVAAYGDNLVFCMKESGSNILVPHDYYYADTIQSGGLETLIFYISNGHVAGLRLDGWSEEAELYSVDNISRFPVKNGVVDFSQRVGPDLEQIHDASRKIFIAFSALTTDKNLSAEEIYQYRRELFSNLQKMRWDAYGALGDTVPAQQEDTESSAQRSKTIEALTQWLQAQKTFSRDELLWLQLGQQSQPDGWVAEEYSGILCHGFFLYPVEFARLLADPSNPAENALAVVGLTSYGADLYPEDRDAAMETLRFAMAGGILSPAEKAWAEVLVRSLSDPYGEKYGQPTAPDLSD